MAQWQLENHVGPVPDMLYSASDRLGEDFQQKFSGVLSSGKIRRLANEYKAQLTDEEYRAFIYFASTTGMLFGFQDEAENEPKVQ